MLYNTIDLEAAYRAGMLRAAEIVKKLPISISTYAVADAIRKEAESEHNS